MEYSDLIRSRESIRNYDPNHPVPKEILERILDAGRLAPSACNYQPWKFLVISSPAILEKVKACYQRDWFMDAPHVLVVIGYKNQAWTRSYDSYNSIETDVAIAMTHIILAAENESVGTCWIAAYNPLLLREALSLAENQLVFGITPLGYTRSGYKKSLTKKRKDMKAIAEFI
jgi:nitroreductase